MTENSPEEPEDEGHNYCVRVGPPTKYTEDACRLIIEAAGRGEHIPGMILAAGARSKHTFYNWQKKYPEFKEAVETAKLVSQAVYEKIGFLGTIGKIKNFNAASWAVTMNNKFSDDYSRTGQSPGTTNITVNNLNMTESQKIERIKGLLQKLNTAGIEMPVGNVYDQDE